MCSKSKLFVGMLEQKIEGHRITIILDDAIVRKLRSRQSKMLMESRKAVTMTSVIKEALKEYLKNEID